MATRPPQRSSRNSGNRSPELASLTRVRTAFVWLRRTSKPISQYPKLSSLSEAERDDATKFASGIYPTPSRWTLKLYHLAKGA